MLGIMETFTEYYQRRPRFSRNHIVRDVMFVPRATRAVRGRQGRRRRREGSGSGSGSGGDPARDSPDDLYAYMIRVSRRFGFEPLAYRSVAPAMYLSSSTPRFSDAIGEDGPSGGSGGDDHWFVYTVVVAGGGRPTPADIDLAHRIRESRLERYGWLCVCGGVCLFVLFVFSPIPWNRLALRGGMPGEM